MSGAGSPNTPVKWELPNARKERRGRAREQERPPRALPLRGQTCSTATKVACAAAAAARFGPAGEPNADDTGTRPPMLFNSGTPAKTDCLSGPRPGPSPASALGSGPVPHVQHLIRPCAYLHAQPPMCIPHLYSALRGAGRCMPPLCMRHALSRLEVVSGNADFHTSFHTSFRIVQEGRAPDQNKALNWP